MNLFEQMFASIAESARIERSRTQMTLGTLIAALERMDGTMLVEGLCYPHSYRGYYSDLAFSISEDRRPVADVLAMARGCMNRTFEGYKGGTYRMESNTPLWIAEYGSCGLRMMGVDAEGNIDRSPDPS